MLLYKQVFFMHLWGEATLKKIILCFIVVFYSCVMPYDKGKINNFYNNIKEELKNSLPEEENKDDASDKIGNTYGSYADTSNIKINNIILEACETCSFVFENNETIIIELLPDYFESLTANINPKNLNSINITPKIVFEPYNAIIYPANQSVQTLVTEHELNSTVCVDFICPLSLNTEEEKNVKDQIKKNIETKILTYTITDPETKLSKTFNFIFKVIEEKNKYQFSLTNNLFNMSKIEPNLTYIRNLKETTVENGYFMASTETSFALWYEVYTWAIKNAYTFINNGSSGSNDIKDDKQPVVNITYYDAIVWTNALTEYYNEINSTDLSFVYIHEDRPIKNAVDLKDYSVNIEASGFRLPDFDEWDLAAKYLGTSVPEYLPLGIKNNINKTAKGDLTYYWISEYVIEDENLEVLNYIEQIAWFNAKETKNVKEAVVANPLGLYDMLGNAAEFCNNKIITKDKTIRLPHRYNLKGASFLSSYEDLLIERNIYLSHQIKNNYIGFRIAKSNR